MIWGYHHFWKHPNVAWDSFQYIGFLCRIPVWVSNTFFSSKLTKTRFFMVNYFRSHYVSGPLSITRWWFQTFFILTPSWGRFPFWLITNIFQRGWNHQLDYYHQVPLFKHQFRGQNVLIVAVRDTYLVWAPLHLFWSHFITNFPFHNPRPFHRFVPDVGVFSRKIMATVGSQLGIEL